MQSCGITIFGALIETERQSVTCGFVHSTNCGSLIRYVDANSAEISRHECSHLSESLIILLNDNETNPGAWRTGRKFLPIFSLNA